MDKLLSALLGLLTKKVFVLLAIVMAFVVAIITWYKDSIYTLINACLFYVFVFIPIILAARDKT